MPTIASCKIFQLTDKKFSKRTLDFSKWTQKYIWAIETETMYKVKRGIILVMENVEYCGHIKIKSDIWILF